MIIRPFYTNDSFYFTQYTIKKDTAFVSENLSNSNQNQAHYLVYTKGAVKFSNIDNTFNLTRQAGETTNTTVVINMPNVVSVEAVEEDSTFFCITKTTRGVVNRIEHRISSGNTFIPNNNLIFLAIGEVSINGEILFAPKVLNNTPKDTMVTTKDSLIIEVF
jgi:hypothetical protein